MANEHSIYKLKPQALCRAYLASAQEDIVSEEPTKVLLDAESFDPGSYFDTANSKFVAPVAGFYQINAQIGYNPGVAEKLFSIRVKVGATLVLWKWTHASVNNGIMADCSDILELAATNEVTIEAYHEAGVDTIDLLNNSDFTFMSIHFLSAS